jgi:hypothetical protein
MYSRKTKVMLTGSPAMNNAAAVIPAFAYPNSASIGLPVANVCGRFSES